MSQFQTRVDGPTAHGGSYSIIHWRDRRGRPTSQTQAEQVLVIEYTQAGRELCRTQAALESVESG